MTPDISTKASSLDAMNQRQIRSRTSGNYDPSGAEYRSSLITTEAPYRGRRVDIEESGITANGNFPAEPGPTQSLYPMNTTLYREFPVKGFGDISNGQYSNDALDMPKGKPYIWSDTDRTLSSLPETDLRALLAYIERVDSRIRQQGEDIPSKQEERHRRNVKYYKANAGIYIAVSVFIAGLGASLMSFAHDNLVDLGQPHNVTDGSVLLDNLSVGCDSSDFTAAVAAFLVSVVYAIFSTLVILSATAGLGVSSWRAMWAGVGDRNGDLGPEDINERVSSFISNLFTAKVLMAVSLVCLLVGLLCCSLCVFSDSAFGIQFLVGSVGVLFVFRIVIARVLIRLYRFVKRLVLDLVHLCF